MDEATEQARSLLAAASADDRLYPLRSHETYGFYAGQLTGGCQGILFWVGPGEVVLLRFSPAGDYLGAEVRSVARPPDRTRQGGALAREYGDRVCVEVGLAPGLVRVKRFSAAPWKVRIRPVEKYHEEFARDPAGYCHGDGADVAEVLAELRGWVDERQFVFVCGNAYWVDDDGEVFSS